MSEDFGQLDIDVYEREQAVSVPVEAVVRVTKHATDRFKERLGLPKRACLKQATKAFDSGLKHCNAKGRARRYLDGVFLKYKTANNIRVHAGGLYIFADMTLITVMLLPKNLLKGFKSP